MRIQESKKEKETVDKELYAGAPLQKKKEMKRSDDLSRS